MQTRCEKGFWDLGIEGITGILQDQTVVWIRLAQRRVCFLQLTSAVSYLINLSPLIDVQKLCVMSTNIYN
jgi:hypothetical protein